MIKSGIYICECMVSDGIYIGKTGSTCGFNKRWAEELNCLRKNKCHNIRWQRSWNKYGKDNFEFRIQEECCDEVIDQREIAWIKYYREKGRNVYNFSDGGKCSIGMLGKHHSEESKIKMSKANKGMKSRLGKRCSYESKNRMSRSHIGKKHSEETKLKMSQSHIGKTAWNKGKILTEETRIKMSKSKIGKRYSDKSRLKMSMAQRERRIREQTRVGIYV